MDLWQALFLGTVQGLTEFLPVSSSGHLVLAEIFLGLKVESLKAFDVMVHLGTLVAIFAYFWKDFRDFILAAWHLLKRTPKDKLSQEVSQHQRWLGYIILGSVPAAIVGIGFEEEIDRMFRNVFSVGVFMVAAAVFFLVAEWLLAHSKKKDDKFNWKKALIIGVAQSVALIPGVSRSGSTIAAAISQGVDRERAARFSFLLGTPAIFGAGLITSLKLMKNGFGEAGMDVLGVGFVSSAIVGYLSVWLLMVFLKKHSLKVFAAYLLIVGGLSIGMTFVLSH